MNEQEKKIISLLNFKPDEDALALLCEIDEKIGIENFRIISYLQDDTNTIPILILMIEAIDKHIVNNEFYEYLISNGVNVTTIKGYMIGLRRPVNSFKIINTLYYLSKTTDISGIVNELNKNRLDFNRNDTLEEHVRDLLLSNPALSKTLFDCLNNNEFYKYLDNTTSFNKVVQILEAIKECPDVYEKLQEFHMLKYIFNSSQPKELFILNDTQIAAYNVFYNKCIACNTYYDTADEDTIVETINRCVNRFGSNTILQLEDVYLSPYSLSFNGLSSEAFNNFVDICIKKNGKIANYDFFNELYHS